MMGPGDIVSCKIREDVIVSTYADFDYIQKFEILANDSYGFYLYVPDYLSIKNTERLTLKKVRELNILPNFLNCLYVYVYPTHISSLISKLDGMKCSKCLEFFQKAEPNKDDGSFICYSCRENPYR